jgi:hypothetical protein
MLMPTVGSQRLLQIAVNQQGSLIHEALCRAGAVAQGDTIAWVSPLASDDYHEYRDGEALRRLRIVDKLHVPLSSFWPKRGAVWDALALVGNGDPLLVEAKAHIPEAASRGTRASAPSRRLIDASLQAARHHLAPRSKVVWSELFYQYANRLAFQFFLRQQNRIQSRLIFLYFTNATDVDGPATEEEWHGAIRLIHAVLGLPSDLRPFAVFEAFLDAASLMHAA